MPTRPIGLTFNDDDDAFLTKESCRRIYFLLVISEHEFCLLSVTLAEVSIDDHEFDLNEL